MEGQRDAADDRVEVTRLVSEHHVEDLGLIVFREVFEAGEIHIHVAMKTMLAKITRGRG